MKKLNLPQRGGFTLVEIMIVVAVIGLLAAIAIPNFVRARNTTQRRLCVSHLRDIDGAKHQWALENGKSDAATPIQDDVRVYIRGERFPACPTGGAYTIGSMTTDPACSKSAAGHTLPLP
jgi:prepilin-type N-terminal cleavage/methylation domain-containing protein